MGKYNLKTPKDRRQNLFSRFQYEYTGVADSKNILTHCYQVHFGSILYLSEHLPFKGSEVIRYFRDGVL